MDSKKIISMIIGFVAIISVPVVLIWGLNTLFAAGIAYTLKNWIAAFLLWIVFMISISSAIQQSQ